MNLEKTYNLKTKCSINWELHEKPNHPNNLDYISKNLTSCIFD